MGIRPTITLSLKQKTAPKSLMRQLVKLLPLNETQLEEAVRREVNENPFLSFPTNTHTNIDDVGGNMGVNIASIYKILIPQIDSNFSDKDHQIAMHFLGDLDDDGFLREYTNPFGQEGINILDRLHHLEPSGVFSRNLPEFYYTYLRAEEKLTPLWERFISHLDSIAMGNIDDAVTAMGSAELFDAFLQDLRDLPTSPNIENTLSTTIIPDIIVTPNEDSFSVSMQSTLHTILHIDSDYVDDVRSHTLKSQDKKFITEKFASAKWLKSALEMRAETLLNIASLLVSEQSEYLKGGNLKPLTMQTIANRAKVNISTVSRIANNKYMQTPIGTIAFKKMFSTDTGAGISQDTIIKMILNLIASEVKLGVVLSDDKIVQHLKKNNVTIARRTVAKYREKHNIAPSSIRKQKLKSKRT